MITVLVGIVLLIVVTGFRLLEVQTALSSTRLKSPGAILRSLCLGSLAAMATALACLALSLLLTLILPETAQALMSELMSLAYHLGLVTPGEFASAAALAVLLLGWLVTPLGYRLFRKISPGHQH